MSPDDSLLFYGGLLSHALASATGLRQLLEDYFGVPVEIEQFVGAWYPLDGNAVLAGRERRAIRSSWASARWWATRSGTSSRGCAFRLGPLTLEQYVDFLPGTRATGSCGR